MATVQELKYKLTADTKQLIEGLKNSNKSVENLSKNFDKAGRFLTKGFTVPLVGAGVGLVALAVKTGKAADRLLDLEQITGLSTDTLQEFKGVAIAAGVDFETLVGSLQRFSARLGTLEEEGSRGAEAVATLGVSLRDSNGAIRDADELFPEFLSALSDVENITERNAIAQEIFGRSIQDLAPVLALGSSGIAEARDRARELGLVLERDALESANDFRIEMDELRASIEVQAQAFAIELMPIIKELIPVLSGIANTVLDAGRAFTNLSEGQQKAIIAALAATATLGPLLVTLGKLALVVPKIGAAMTVLASPAALGALAVGAPILVGVGALVGLFATMERLTRTIRENNESINDSARATNEQVKANSIEYARIAQEQLRSLDADIRQLKNRARLNDRDKARLALLERQRDAIAENLKVAARQLEIERLQAEGQLEKAAQLFEEQRQREQLEETTRKQTAIAVEAAEKELALAEQRAEIEESYAKKLREISNSRLELLRIEKVEEIKKAEEVGASTVDIVKFYDAQIETEKQAAADRKEQIEGDYQQRVNLLGSEGVELRVAQLEIEKEKALQIADEAGAERENIEKFYNSQIEAARRETTENIKQNKLAAINEEVQGAQAAVSAELALLEALKQKTLEHYSLLEDAFFAYHDKRKREAQLEIQEIERALEVALNAEDIRSKTAIERLDERIATAKEAGNTELVEDLEREKKRTELKEEAEKKIAQIKYEQGLADWERNKNIAKIETAIAVIKAFASAPPPIGAALAAAVGYVGYQQYQNIVASKPQPPRFHQGGVVQGSFGQEVGAILKPREMVLTEAQQRQLFEMANGQAGGGSIVVNMNTALNTDSQKNLELAARALYPYIQREGARRG